MFRAGRPGAKISPNLAGLAADFALCYQVLRHSDPGYADGCLRSAETVYSLADPHWKGHLMTAIPWDFYPETTWRDDMMLGATELARALQEAGHPAALPGRPAGPVRRDLPARRRRLGQRLDPQQAGAGRHAEPLRRQRAGRLRTDPHHARAARQPAWP